MIKYFETTVLLSLFAIMPVAFAHHSLAPHYDLESQVTIEGIITDFKLVNPHAVIYLDVTNDDGTVANWNCELGAGSKLIRDGWTEDLFTSGKTMKIDGIMARRDPHGCSYRSGILDGEIQVSRDGGLSHIERPQIERHVVTTEDLKSFNGLWTSPLRQRGGGQAADGGQGGRQRGQLGVENRLLAYMTEAGVAATEKYDMRFDDPALQCSPSSIIRAWGEPNVISEIEQTGEQVIIRHEFMDTVRVVHLDTREHPTNIEPSLTGHSVGWFEDNVLVVDTIHFKAGVLVPHPGAMHTENMHVVERLSLSDDGQQLTREYEVIDPEYWKQPYSGRSIWIRTDIPLPAYDCTELSGISKIRPDDRE